MALFGSTALPSVVSELESPVKSFCSCSGSLGAFDLDVTSIERGGFNDAYLTASTGRKE